MLSHILRSTFFYALFVVTVCGTSKAEVREASVPSLNSAPTVRSVTAGKSFKRLIKTQQGTQTEQDAIKTNGTVLDQGNIVVDNIVEPKCVFYGNYNDIAGDISQSFSIDTIIFECK